MMFGFFYIIIAIIILCIMAHMIVVIPEYCRGVRFRLGRFTDILLPGANIILPSIDQVEIVDLRTRTLEVPWQKVITADNAMVGADAVIYYKVVQPSTVILRVENYEMATTMLAQTTLRSIIGKMTLDELLTKRKEINVLLIRALDDFSYSWGVRLQAVEIRELKLLSKAVFDAMMKEVAAERVKRAMILESEGGKQVAITLGEAQMQVNVITGEGVKKAEVIKAEGNAVAIEKVSESARKNLVDEALTLKQLEMYKTVNRSKKTCLILPYNLSEMMKSTFSRIGD